MDASLLISWTAIAYRHIPLDDPFAVVDTTAAAMRGEGRWHDKGEHTLYLASDAAIVLAEFARHMRESRSAAVTRGLRDRHIFRLHVELESVADLRDVRVCEALGVEPDPAWIRELARTRAVASAVRRESGAQALVVPSMAFMDQPERWNLVVFREKVTPYPGTSLTHVRRTGVIRPRDILGADDHPSDALAEP